MAAALLALVLASLAIIVYGDALRHLVRQGGHVVADHFGLPDLLTGGTLAFFFTGVMVQAVWMHGGERAEITVDQLLPNQLFLVAVVAGLSGFLIYRHLSPARIFGLGAFTIPRTVVLAVIFIAAAMPIVACTNYLSMLMLREMADEQELVSLFRDLARDRDYAAMGKAFLATAILAPAFEEFLFRGYFYGVGKRYLGSLASALATSLVFAAFHLNLASLPGLFVLALCLTAAYERTGSLLVPIGMHALYNCTSLAILFLDAQGAFRAIQS